MSIFSSKDTKQLKEILARLERMEKQLEDIEKLLLPQKYVPLELERAIVAVGRRARSIDAQVEDLP